LRSAWTGPSDTITGSFLLDDAQGHDKPLLVVIDGRDKPFSTTFSDADYAAGRHSEYRARNPRSISRGSTA
jgi:hypothetical protein